MTKTDEMIEEKVEKWIKEQHGSAGWEQKLVNLCVNIAKAAREEALKDLKKKLPRKKQTCFAQAGYCDGDACCEGNEEYKGFNLCLSKIRYIIQTNNPKT